MNADEDYRAQMTGNAPIGFREACEALGVTSSIALRYVNRDHFPASVATPHAERARRRPDALAWGMRTVPLPVGRSRTEER